MCVERQTHRVQNRNRKMHVFNAPQGTCPQSLGKWSTVLVLFTSKRVRRIPNYISGHHEICHISEARKNERKKEEMGKTIVKWSKKGGQVDIGFCVAAENRFNESVLTTPSPLTRRPFTLGGACALHRAAPPPPHPLLYDHLS